MGRRSNDKHLNSFPEEKSSGLCQADLFTNPYQRKVGAVSRQRTSYNESTVHKDVRLGYTGMAHVSMNTTKTMLKDERYGMKPTDSHIEQFLDVHLYAKQAWPQV